MSIPRRVVGLPPAQGFNRRSGRGQILRTLDEKLRCQAVELGIELRWSPLILGLTIWVVLATVGIKLAGGFGAAAGTGLISFALLLARRGRRRRLSSQSQGVLPEVCVRLSRTIRSGRSVEEALVEVASQVSPLPSGVLAVAGQSSSGRPLTSAIDEWVLRGESSAEQLLSAALLLGIKQGGDLSRALDLVGGGLRDDLDLATRRRVLLMQATMSAAVLVMLPLGFAVVASVLRGGMVFQGRVGAVLVAAGLTLDVLGCLWMRSLMRGLR